MRPPSWRCVDVATPHRAKAQQAGWLVPWCVGRKDWLMGQVHTISTSSRVVRVAVRAIWGKARLNPVLYVLGDKQINTSVVERHNSTSRPRHRRTGRETLPCSNATRYHRWLRGLSVGLYHFCHAHRS